MCVGAVEVVVVEPNMYIEPVRFVLGLGIMAIVVRFLKIVRTLN